MNWLAQEYGNLASVVGLLISLATLVVAARTQRVVELARHRIFANLDASDGVARAFIIETQLSELTF